MIIKYLRENYSFRLKNFDFFKLKWKKSIFLKMIVFSDHRHGDQATVGSQREILRVLAKSRISGELQRADGGLCDRIRHDPLLDARVQSHRRGGKVKYSLFFNFLYIFAIIKI